jgi:class 3 adenylate cyclase
MMLVVSGSAAMTLITLQRRVESSNQRLFQRQFDQAIASFSAMQEARLDFVKRRCREAGQSVRLRAALVAADEEGSVDLLYENATDELRDVLGEASLFRFLGPDGALLSPPDAVQATFTADVTRIWKGLEGAAQQTGLLALRASSGDTVLNEVIATKVVHPVSEEALGALILAFPVPELSGEFRSDARTTDSLLLGFLLDDRLFVRPEGVGALHRRAIEDALRRETSGTASLGDFEMTLGDEPYRFLYRAADPNSALPSAYQVSLYSLADERRDERQLRMTVLALAALGLAGAFALATFLSHGLTVPIQELVAATGEVRRGNLDVQVRVRSGDEIGRLAGSFNEMTVGLAQKEKYRSVLNMVADTEVAEQLLSGKTVALGGERRDVTVLFCDIRGFTEMTRPMQPEEVIVMLNEHMTALTRVVKEYHGVVDKFVGDLIMAVFGAPMSHGDDLAAGCRCALRMIEERERLNRTSRHVVRVGIGLASGPAVAGCMGSADRLNYTVLGERVNLASRLCSRAGPMEVVVDDVIAARVAGSAVTEALPPMQLKGFDVPVPAFRLVGWR